MAFLKTDLADEDFLLLALSKNKFWKFILVNVLTSASWDLAISTRVLAAGCTMSKFFKMVAPSFDIMDFPAKQRIHVCHMLEIFFFFFGCNKFQQD